jgi:hypothetical protein
MLNRDWKSNETVILYGLCNIRPQEECTSNSLVWDV